MVTTKHFIVTLLGTAALAASVLHGCQPQAIPTADLPALTAALRVRQDSLNHVVEALEWRRQLDSLALDEQAQVIDQLQENYHAQRQVTTTKKASYVPVVATTPVPAVAYIAQLEVTLSAADSVITHQAGHIDSLQVALVHEHEAFTLVQRQAMNANEIIATQAQQLANDAARIEILRKRNRRLWIANILQAAGHLVRR